MALRLIHDPEEAAETGTDPRDPTLYRRGLSSARAELRRGVARRHEREVHALESDAPPSDPTGHDGEVG